MSSEPEIDAAQKATASKGHRVDVARSRMSRATMIIPLLVFAALGVVLAIGLGLDPRLVPSPLIGKSVPEFELPPVRGRSLGLGSENLSGAVSLVNVFASWCVACRAEHPLLMTLARQGTISVHGLNYKDRPEDAAAWLDELGDPYMRTGADVDGRVGIDWGVYGVPETFLIDAQGRIAFKQIGAITPAVLEEQILPLARRLAAKAAERAGETTSR